MTKNPKAFGPDVAMGRPLVGIRVVSLEQYISAPYCTQILADAGAEVIKVERGAGGDPRRSYEPAIKVGQAAVSGGFAPYNRGKHSATLDIHTLDGSNALEALLDNADVFVSNLRPGALQRAGFDFERIRVRWPRLVVCEISGFGVTGGPLMDESAFDTVIQAMSGFAGLVGTSQRPALAPMSTMDLLTGIWAAAGISMALVHRERSGMGSHVDTAMLDVGAALIERALSLAEATGSPAVTGGADQYSPAGVFPAADSMWVAIVIPTDEMWARFCAAIEDEELLHDSDLSDASRRARQMDDLILPAAARWAAAGALTASEVVTELRAHGLPAGVVADVAAVRNSPQLAHRKFFSPLSFIGPDGSEIQTGLSLPRSALVFDGTPPTPGAVPRYRSSPTPM